tara:strand:- start:11 stop:517 length:507 start_codon:yes stop_codon:yes gene_type:complete
MTEEKQNTGFIPKNEYVDVIKKTQIISTDFLIFNNEGQVLLGLRNNEPAKNTWFVPGGRVYKHEMIDDAVKRITKQELGQSLTKTSDLGVYHHIYPNNFDNNDHGTHYVVFAVNIVLESNDSYDLTQIPDDQHSTLKWWNVEDILSDPNVHNYTKNYFHPTPYNKAFF